MATTRMQRVVGRSPNSINSSDRCRTISLLLRRIMPEAVRVARADTASRKKDARRACRKRPLRFQLRGNNKTPPKRKQLQLADLTSTMK